MCELKLTWCNLTWKTSVEEEGTGEAREEESAVVCKKRVETLIGFNIEVVRKIDGNIILEDEANPIILNWIKVKTVLDEEKEAGIEIISNGSVL